MNAARSVLSGRASDGFTFDNLATFRRLQNSTVTFDLKNDRDLVLLFGWRAAFYAFRALQRIDDDKATHNELLPDLWTLSQAHSEFIAVSCFFSELSTSQARGLLDIQSHNVLWDLLRLFALDLVSKEPQGFYVSGALNVDQVENASRNQIAQLLERIRPHAIRLVDSWMLPDWLLDSALGRHDGKVYEDLFRRASDLNPLNKLTISPYPEIPASKKHHRERL